MSIAADRYNRSEKGRARWRAYSFRRYWKRRDEGVCVGCGDPIILSEALCWDCLNAREFAGVLRI